MSIDNNVLAYLKWKGEVTTEQVYEVTEGDEKAIYVALRRLTLQGRVIKRIKREGKTRRRIAFWSLNRAWKPAPVAPQSWLSALEWRVGAK